MAPKPQRGVNWKPQEDETLCKGWVSIFEDGAIGTNQSNNSCWLRVYQNFLENDPDMSGARVRSPQAIASRINIINQQCSLWKACMTKANSRHVSGSNLEDVIAQNGTTYVNLPQKHSKILLIVAIQSIWRKMKMMWSCPLQSRWEEINRRMKKKKGKGVEGYLNQNGKFLSELDQQGNEAKKDRRRKLELLQEQHAYQIQQDKEANEQRIMSMDLSKFTPRKKKYWGNKQNEFIEAQKNISSPYNPEDNSRDYYPSPPHSGY
ncbi:unnamed protein product [Prunus brigantina]